MFNCITLQFVHFARSYNITPSVLISASHRTTESGNSAPVHNGITTWIEVRLFFSLTCKSYYGYSRKADITDLRDREAQKE